MKDILVLLILLTAKTIKVCSSQPYQADSDGNCRNTTTEYLLEDYMVCCKKCRPGEQVKQPCSETTDTVCEPCPEGLYKESWNFSPTCFTCVTCRPKKNMLAVQKCSPTTRSKCGCKPGTFCIMGFDDPYCEACQKYYPCKVGYGVYQPGTANTDVKCQRCPDGTFSDTVSSTDRCRPHTICSGRIVKKGNSTSDTECEHPTFSTQPQTSTKEPHPEIVFTTASMMMTTVSATSHATLSNSLSLSAAVFNHSTKSPQPSTLSGSALAAAIAIPIVTGVMIFSIVLILLWKKICNTGAPPIPPKVDANGNCDTGDKINQDYSVETQLTSFTVTAPEQQYLLYNGETCSDQSQSSNTSETFTRTDGCSSCESIGPLQSTLPLDSPHSALSEPRTLQSNTEPVTPQTSVPTQCSSQPTSPQIISPVTPSPHVNVNIILNIGNGSGGTPSVVPTDLMQVDSKLRFGEEEASFSVPQQEDGKQSLMSVQETESYSV